LPSLEAKAADIVLKLGLATAGGGQAGASHKGELFCTMIEQFDTLFRDAVGSLQSLIDPAARLGERAARRCRTRLGVDPSPAD
jgi:hypothetical protein